VATDTTPRSVADGSPSGRADASADEAVGSLLLPIGHYVGVQHRTGPAGATRQVRRGGTVHDLTDDQFAAWKLAHGTADAVANQTAWHRDSVEEQARAAGLGGAASVVDDLLEAGLLVEVGPEGQDPVGFATSHRLVPLMLGLGNSSEEPNLFGIGFLHQPALLVSHAIYDVWQWSTMDDSLLATCENAVDVARRAGYSEPEFVDVPTLLSGVIASLHALLFANAAYLDIGFRLRWPLPSRRGVPSNG
jgi:hypothetical protein